MLDSLFMCRPIPVCRNTTALSCFSSISIIFPNFLTLSSLYIIYILYFSFLYFIQSSPSYLPRSVLHISSQASETNKRALLDNPQPIIYKFPIVHQLLTFSCHWMGLVIQETNMRMYNLF